MKFVTAILTLAVPIISLAWSPITSSNFSLIILSTTNTTLNNTVLSTCHTGAAINGLCTTHKPIDPSHYSTNFTHSVGSDITHNKSDGTISYLWYGGAGDEPVQSSLSMAWDPETNIVQMIFSPGQGQGGYAFDYENKMFRYRGTDDTVYPSFSKYPPFPFSTKPDYNWYVCTVWAGSSYLYETLNWVIGVHAKPQNPTCQAVNVTRVFNSWRGVIDPV